MDFLIVENDEITGWVIKNNLLRLGHLAYVTETGKKALNLFFKEFNAILLDVDLPDMHGIEVARSIRAREEKRNIIIGIANYANRIRDPYLFDAVFEKPINLFDLKRILQKVEVQHA